MTLPNPSNCFGGALLFIFLASFCGFAQAPGPASARVPTLPPPAPPAISSPVDFFRELLALTPAKRKDALAGRPDENQRMILAKVHEYEALSANERELRLRSTELRWYLLSFMQTPPTNRLAQLERVPAELRPLVEVRVAAWDEMPENLRRELLQNEAAIRHLNERRDQLPSPGNADPGGELAFATHRWVSMEEGQRRDLLNRFEQFFGLSAREQQVTLESLSATERRQIQATLASFANLSAAQRAQCIRSLNQFANLSPEERKQFLVDAGKWQRMTPDHRKAWRDMVTRLSLQPPLPPGAGQMPPLPTATKPLVTNGS